jgi:hypothetical protein
VASFFHCSLVVAAFHIVFIYSSSSHPLGILLQMKVTSLVLYFSTFLISASEAGNAESYCNERLTHINSRQ